MPRDIVQSPYSQDADLLRRMADYLEQHVKDEHYYQPDPNYCATGHCRGGNVYLGRVQDYLQTHHEWRASFNRLFGSQPVNRSRKTEIRLLRARAAKLDALALA